MKPEFIINFVSIFISNSLPIKVLIGAFALLEITFIPQPKLAAQQSVDLTGGILRPGADLPPCADSHSPNAPRIAR